jgi:hypothetical protein
MKDQHPLKRKPPREVTTLVKCPSVIYGPSFFADLRSKSTTGEVATMLTISILKSVLPPSSIFTISTSRGTNVIVRQFAY